jgi:hypothetical protein
MASIFQGRLLAKPTVASLFRMEEVVAIKIVDSKCKTHFVLTWGRAFGAVSSEPLLSAVRRQLGQFGIQAVRSIRICETLQAASDQPYFYEALMFFSQQRVPYGKSYLKWRTTRRKQIEAGNDIYYLAKRASKSC